jgi:hypothetical protein
MKIHSYTDMLGLAPKLLLLHRYTSINMTTAGQGCRPRKLATGARKLSRREAEATSPFEVALNVARMTFYLFLGLSLSSNYCRDSAQATSFSVLFSQ